MTTRLDLSTDFQAACKWTRLMRDTFLSRFYKKYSYDGRYVFVDKSDCSTLLQKELAIDTIMQYPKSSVCIEEKIEQWPKNGRKRTNFALETDSCTVRGHERKGWMHYARADYLLDAFAYEGNSEMD